jgi:hypothetical protein
MLNADDCKNRLRRKKTMETCRLCSGQKAANHEESDRHQAAVDLVEMMLTLSPENRRALVHEMLALIRRAKMKPVK